MNDTLWWVIGIGLAVSVLGGIAAVIVVVHLPPDYFARPPAKTRWHGNLGRKLLKIAKNIAGLLLIAGGLVLVFPGVPGPGVVIVLLGLVITDIPGKHRLIVKVARMPAVLRSMNRIRRRFGRPDLVTP